LVNGVIDVLFGYVVELIRLGGSIAGVVIDVVRTVQSRRSSLVQHAQQPRHIDLVIQPNETLLEVGRSDETPSCP